MLEQINRGAEAILYLDREKNVIVKERDIKNYRLLEFDLKIRKFRNKREYKVLKKAKEAGINVPHVFDLIEDIKANKFSFSMDFIKGDILAEILTETFLLKALDQIINLHKAEIVHFDLTTLNMLACQDDVYLIDFGLAQFSRKIEDRAEDLNLFFNCIKNEHNNLYFLKDKLKEIYIHNLEFGNRVIERLNDVEKRGRNK